MPTSPFVRAAVFVTPVATPFTRIPKIAVSKATVLISIYTIAAAVDIKGDSGSGATP